MNEKVMEKSKRIWEIDFLRGLAIILMVLDHLVFDFGNFDMFFTDFNILTLDNVALYNFINFCQDVAYSDIRLIFHHIFSNLFFLLVGISCCFSKNNFKRGALVLLCGVVIDIASYILFYASKESIDVRMIFNVLVTIGLCILMTELLMKIKYHKWICLALGVIIIILSIIFGLYNPYWISDFEFESLFNILIGKESYGADCFSIVPYIGPVFIGVFVGKTVYKEKKSILPMLDKSFNKPICFIGRKTIWVYFIHQVIILTFIFIIGLSLGYHIF